MSKRQFSKSKFGTVSWFRRNFVGFKKNWIIGLLNKYVGKSYNACKKEYDAHVRELCGDSKELRGWELDDFIAEEKGTCYRNQMFWLDNAGNIRRCKMISAKKHYNPTSLTAAQKLYNKKVRIPDLGLCRTFSRMAFEYYKVDLGREDFYHYLPQAKHPILLGEFYVAVEGRVMKLPVYTYKNPMMIEYWNHRAYEYNWRTRKNEYTPFEYGDPRATRDNSLVERKRQIREEWIPVHGRLGDNYPTQQTHFESMQPLEVTRLMRDIEWYETNQNIPGPYQQEYIKKLAELRERLNSLPAKTQYNLGYGQFYLFVRRKTFELKLKGY